MNKDVLTSPVLEALLQAPSLAVSAVDKQGCVILWSPSASHMFGWTESEALGHFLPIIPQDRRQEFLDWIEKGIKGGTVSALEARRLRKDGTLIDVNLWTSPLKDSKGDIIGLLGVHADITVRKQAEQALGQTRAELQRVLASVSDYLWSGEFDPAGKFSYDYYSPAVERITGRPAEFYLAGPERWLSTIHPEDRPRLAAALGRLQMGHSTREEEEYRFMLPDGTIRWVRDSVTVSQFANGRRHLNGVVSDITARKQSEEALRESEVRFRGIFTAAATGIVVVSPEGRFLQANPAFCDFVGYSEQELVNKKVQDVTHPDDRQRSEELRRSVWDTAKSQMQSYEKRYLRKNGQAVWGEVSMSLIRDGRGNAVYSIAHILDITERKQAETAARESEERFRALIEHSFDVVAVVEADATIRFASASTVRVLGYEPHELIGHTALELVHPEDLPHAIEVLNRLITTPGGTVVDQFRCRHKDDSWRWIEVSGTNCLAQPAVGGIIVNYRDITERKQAEDVLCESEERYRTLAESATEAIFIIDRDDRVQYLNTYAASMIGSTPRELTGKRRAELFPPDTSEHQRREIAAVFESGQPRRIQNKTPFDGGELWLDTQLVPLRNADGEVNAVMGISRDITEQKRTEVTLRESEERYRLMVEAIPQLAWRTDPQGGVVECNSRWYEYTGQTTEEARGFGWKKALHPDDVGRAIQSVQEDVAAEELMQVEYRLRRASDGSYRWHLARMVPIKDKDGQIASWFGSAVDIEDQKRVQETLEERVRERTAELTNLNKALRESEAKYRSLVEQIPAVTYTAALKAAKTLYVSPQIETTLGYTQSDFQNNPKAWIQQVHPHDHKRVIAEINRTREVGEPFDCEYRLLHRNGKIIWVRDRAAVVHDETGRPIFVQGVMFDITERRQAEETMRLQSTALGSAANGIFITDREGNILWVNPAFAETTGYVPSEIIGKTPRLLKSGRHDKAFYQHLWQTILSGLVWHGEIINKRKDGSLYTEETTITPVRNSASEITHFITIKQDITEWKSAEESRRQLAAIVESSDDAIISSDLNGIVTSWNAGAQQLYDYAPEEIIGRSFRVLVPPNRRAEARETVKKVRCGDYVRIETVRLKKDRSPVNVSNTLSPIKNDVGRVIGISVIAHDITERKELEQAIVEAGSREQRRIGLDLHDGLCQQLTGVGFLWKAIARRQDVQALLKATEVAEISQLITKTIGEARDLAKVLCPVELENNDFGVALKDLGLSIERLFAVSCLVRCQQPVLLADKTVATHLYRIAQEATNNAIQHGKAARVWIHLAWKKNKLTLRIRDNGSGFSKRRGFKEGIGMRSMKYRAKAIGGSLTIESQRGAGTIVSCVYIQQRSS